MIVTGERWVRRQIAVEVYCDQCGISTRVKESEDNRCYEFEYGTLRFDGGYHSRLDSMAMGAIELHFCEDCTDRMRQRGLRVRMRRAGLDLYDEQANCVDSTKVAELYELSPEVLSAWLEDEKQRRQARLTAEASPSAPDVSEPSVPKGVDDAGPCDPEDPLWVWYAVAVKAWTRTCTLGKPENFRDWINKPLRGWGKFSPRDLFLQGHGEEILNDFLREEWGIFA